MRTIRYFPLWFAGAILVAAILSSPFCYLTYTFELFRIEYRALKGRP